MRQHGSSTTHLRRHAGCTFLLVAALFGGAAGCLCAQQAPVRSAGVEGPERQSAAKVQVDSAARSSVFKMLDASSAFNSSGPLALIRIVNTLQPLGKDRALGILEEYRQAKSGDGQQHWGLMLVPRILFTVAVTSPPLWRISCGWHPRPPTNRADFQTFPVAVVQGVPLVLPYSAYGAGGGFAATEKREIEYFQNYGIMRPKPLCPSNDPLNVLMGCLVSSKEWRRIYWTNAATFHWKAGVNHAATQIASLAADVASSANVAEYRNLLLSGAASGPLPALRWDAERMVFESENGERGKGPGADLVAP